MDNIKKCITSLLTSATSTLTIHQLNVDYMNFIGERIPHQKLGFNSLEQFLKSIPETVQVCGSGLSAKVLPVESQKSSHVMQLVARQKKNGTKRQMGYYRKDEATDVGKEVGSSRELELEVKFLRILVEEMRDKSNILKMTNELLLSRVKHLEAESHTSTRNANLVSTSQNAGDSNKIVIQQSGNEISNSKMVEEYQNSYEWNEWDSDDINHIAMENESRKEETSEIHLGCGKVAHENDWDHTGDYNATEKNEISEKFSGDRKVAQESEQNCNDICFTTLRKEQNSPWDFNDDYCTTKKMSLGREYTSENRFGYREVAQENEWDDDCYATENHDTSENSSGSRKVAHTEIEKEQNNSWDSNGDYYTTDENKIERDHTFGKVAHGTTAKNGLEKKNRSCWGIRADRNSSCVGQRNVKKNKSKPNRTHHW